MSKAAILQELRETSVSEALAAASLEKQRWGDTPSCPLCGSVEVYRMIGRDAQRNKDYRWRCRDCKGMYTVRTRTVFEETRLPLRVWVYAIWKAASGKKGYSALQLAREMEITHKSALFVLRRIRHGVGDESIAKMTGTVEVDEVYLGGRPRYRGGDPMQRKPKTPVVGIVQRDGDVRFKVMPRVTAANLKDFIAENADRTCRLITDDSNAYKGRWGGTGWRPSLRQPQREAVRPVGDGHSLQHD